MEYDIVDNCHAGHGIVLDGLVILPQYIPIEIEAEYLVFSVGGGIQIFPIDEGGCTVRCHRTVHDRGDIGGPTVPVDFVKTALRRCYDAGEIIRDISGQVRSNGSERITQILNERHRSAVKVIDHHAAQL